jgi:hypothetical protein
VRSKTVHLIMADAQASASTSTPDASNAAAPLSDKGKQREVKVWNAPQVGSAGGYVNPREFS